MPAVLVNIAYLIAASLFIMGLKALTRPRTAIRGNLLSAIGMLVAIVVTLLDQHIMRYEWIIAGIILGGAIGAIMATQIQMTAMPQMVALLNGFGGGASLGVAVVSYMSDSSITMIDTQLSAATMDTITLLAIGLTALVGSVTIMGSLIAFAKLQALIPGHPMSFVGLKFVTALLLAVAVLAIYKITIVAGNNHWLMALIVVSALLGLLLVLPIGGADMPVVIALLNAYSGIAVAFTGFIMSNVLLIIVGSLVGASGLILTHIMCVAMNRSLSHVLFGVMAKGTEIIDTDAIYQNKIKSTSAEEVAMLLETANRVVIVPGFGMAMAQAQHAVREMACAIEGMGSHIEYAIHPVAGRMPGHMNVLLAEAEVPYEKLIEMDTINPTFKQTDVVIVVGANDVTNPMAREDSASPIYGMPILNVDQAKTVVVIKRSLSPGFAGLPNPLFAKDNTLMLFGDAKQAMLDITQALKET